jgi:hypothetical protein
VVQRFEFFLSFSRAHADEVGNTMSTIIASPVPLPVYASLNPAGASNPDATAQALSDLSTALQSGNVTAAQTALASRQKALGQGTSSSQTATDATTTSTSPFGSDSQANSDYKNLVSAINSGNVTDAQNALSNLQKDLKSHHGGHHGHGAPPPTQVSAVDTTSTSDATSSSSGNYVNVTV